ncbi:hypothetical protein BH10PSE12_BH10PSE12_17040 [soil metagenome]
MQTHLRHGLRATMALALCASSFLYGTGAANAQTATAPTAGTSLADSDTSDGNEILVTARRVKERLEDVPLSISAFGGDDLARNNHVRLEDLNQLAPNTNVTSLLRTRTA